MELIVSFRAFRVAHSLYPPTPVRLCREMSYGDIRYFYPPLSRHLVMVGGGWARYRIGPEIRTRLRR